MVVDEWDKFELQREEEKIKNMKVEDLSDMAKLEVEVKKTREKKGVGFNSYGVSVREIANEEEFKYYHDWATKQVNSTILAMEFEGKSTHVSKETYTKTNYPAEQGSPSNAHPASKVTPRDLTTTFLKGKQKDHAVKLINLGKVSLQQVNDLQSWDEQQSLIYSDENKKVLFGK